MRAKRVVAVLLCLLMTLNLIPASAFAEATDASANLVAGEAPDVLTAAGNTSEVLIKVWPSGDRFSIVAEAGDSVENVKSKIEDKTGIPPERQMLYYNNKKLEDGKLLLEYDIDNTNFVILYELVTVTYKVEGGTWGDGTTEDQTETVASGDSPRNVPTGMIASSGYADGAWDADPTGATITGDTDFTYTFEAVSTYTVTVNGGAGGGEYVEGTDVTIVADEPEGGKQFKEWAGADELVFTAGNMTDTTATFSMPANAVTITATYEDTPAAIYAVTVNGGSGGGEYAEGTDVAIVADDPEEGMRFKEWVGAEDLTFIEGGAGSAEATFAMPAETVAVTATYEEIPVTIYTVTYKVVNGTWEDGSTEDKTEAVASGTTPDSVPTGMIAGSGYTGGAWDADPTSAVIAEDTAFTYSFESDAAVGATQNGGYGLINDIPASDGGYVWMGGENPIKWLVIGANDSNYLLISTEVLGGTMNWEDAKSYGATVLASFTAAEQAAVPETDKSEPEDYQLEFGTGFFGRSEVRNKSFLMSVAEIQEYFDSSFTAKPGGWWLRSPYTLNGDTGGIEEKGAGAIDGDGGLQVYGIIDNSRCGVRPAFQLNRASILFESAAEGGKSSAAAGDGAFGTFQRGKANRKLTLLDSSRSGFDASVEKTTVAPGEILAVSYSGAQTGESEYVSALLSDESGTVLYYASLTPDSSGAGTWAMTLPDDLADGSSYTLKVFSEQQSGDFKTDYASLAMTATLTVDDPDFIHVSTWRELRHAALSILPTGGLTPMNKIRLTSDVVCPDDEPCVEVGREVTIDLNGHTMDRHRSEREDSGHVIEVFDGGKLIIEDGSASKTGKITGGWTKGGGGIYIHAGGTLNFNGGAITGNRATLEGGGVYVLGTMNMAGGSVSGNTASEIGGGIYIGDKGTLRLSGGAISENESSGDGGGIFVDKGGKLTFDGGTISGNTAGSDGGGISVHGTLGALSAAFGAPGGTIENNDAEETGGGIYVESTGSIDLCLATVSGNTAGDDGGGLNVHLGAKVGYIRGGAITNNRTSGSGGGLRMTQDGATLEIRGTTIEDNSAGEDGGGIYAREGSVEMMEGSVSNNKAGAGGGGVNVKGGAIFKATDVAIEGNTALKEEGGGIKNCGTATLSSCSVTGNSASTHGGGIYVESSATETNIEGAVVVTDNSSVFGENVYLCGKQKLTCTGSLSEGSMIGVDLESGTGTLTEDYSAYHNTYHPESLTDWFSVAEGFYLGFEGGEVVVSSGWKQVEDCIEQKLEGGDSYPLSVEGDYYTLLESCAATPSDGRIEIDDDRHVWVDLNGYTLNRNLSSKVGSGHVFEVYGGSALTIIDSSGTDSSPGYGKITGGWSGYGGGIYVHEGGTLIIDGGTITGNTATENGGGIYLEEGAKLYLRQAASICGNRAGKRGGGVYANDYPTKLFIQDSPVVQGNYASVLGANIYLPYLLTVSGELKDGAQIGVTKAGAWGIITDSYGCYNSGTNPSQFFTSDECFEVALTQALFEEVVLRGETFGKTDDEDPFIEWNDQMKDDTDALTSRNWMAGISGERYLNEINIPGSHDAAMNNIQELYLWDWTSTIGTLGLYGTGKRLAKTQTTYIDEQLRNGARMFDLRLTDRKKKEISPLIYDWYDDGKNVWLCHGEQVGTGCYLAWNRDDEFLSFVEVLGWVRDFLEEHPTETVILHIRPQSTESGHSGKIYKRAKDALDQHADILYKEPGLDYSDSNFAAYTHMPQLKDCRGKIVLWFEYGGGVRDDDGNTVCGGFTVDKEKGACGSKYTDPTDHTNNASEQISSITNSYARLNDGSVTLPDNADTNCDFLWHWELNCTGEGKGFDYFWEDIIFGLENPVKLALEVNSALVGDKKLFGPQIAGQYIGWVKMDDFDAKYAEAIWRTNFFDDLQYCTVTVESGVDDPRFPSQTYKLLKGTTITIPGNIYQNPHPQEGAEFGGWTTGSNSEPIEGTYKVDQDVVFTAKWLNTGHAVTYKVVNGTWEGGAAEDITETVSNGATPASVPTGMVASPGYRGGAWDVDPTTATITGDTTFTYAFEEIPTYTVRFDANVPANASTACAGSMDDQSLPCDEKKALNTNGYSLPGYDFTGWNTKADGTGTPYADEEEVQGLSEDGGTVTLHAQWDPKSYIIVYIPGEEGVRPHNQEAYFDQPGTLDKYSDEAYGWDSSGKALHGWAGAGLGSFYEDGEDFYNLCGAPDADGNLADVTLTADWVQNGQIVVTVTKDGVPQGGLSEHLKLVQGTTEFTVPISDKDVGGRYVFDPAGATIGGQLVQLPSGDYVVQFEALGFPSASAEITYGESSAVSVVFDYYTVSLSKDPVYASFNEVEISGGVPVADAPGAVVALDGDELGIKTSVSEGYRFEGYIAVGVMPTWEEGDSSKQEQTIEVHGQVDIMALVAPIEYTVTVVGGTAYKAKATLGETVTITANAPEDGYAFVQWTGDGVGFDNESSTETTFTMPADDVMVRAVYALIVIESIEDKVYNGSAIEPFDKVKVSLKGVDLQLTDDDYGVSFGNNVNAGSATVTVTMKSPRAGSATSTFKIAPKPATITVDNASKVQGEADPAFAGTVDGLVAEGDLGNVKYVRTGDDEDPGIYGGVLTATYDENPNYDVTIAKGDFTIKERRTVRWLDGDGSVLQEKTYGKGDEPPAYDGKEPTRAATTRYTYAFTGWDGGTVDGATTTYRPLFFETLNRYEVTFVDYDGTTVLKDTAEYDYGTAAADIARPADPTREADAEYAYVFSGWTPEVADVTADAVYTAVYESGKRSYEITWLQDDGTLIDKTTVEYGEVPAHADPAKPATAEYTYAFAGWEPEVAAVTGDATYQATYTEHPVPTPTDKGTLTFDLGGGTLDGKTGTITIVADVGDVIQLPGAPTREGYTFKYWRGSKYDAGADYEVKGDHAFAAEWEKDAPAPAAKHTVAFDVNGHGMAPAAQEVEDGKTATRPADPKADGWTFGGWFTNKDCTIAYDFSKPVTADVTLFAKWTQASSGGTKGTPSDGTKGTPSNAPSGSSTSLSPKTGDDVGGIVAALSIMAACALCPVLFAGLRRRRDGQVDGDSRAER